MHTDAWEKRRALWQRGGWSEHISTHDSMLGSFVSRQEGTRVGKKRIWGGGGRLKCLCMCALGHMSVFYLSLCTVLMWITILALPLLCILAWIRHKRQKASYLCLRVKDYLFHWMCPPIICLSLSVLFNLFLVSAQWLPLTVSPSQM